MAIAIQHKRGVLANRPALASGEFYWATDTKQLFIDSTPTLVGSLTNSSTADQTINAATTALLTGSLISVPAGKLRIGTAFRFSLSVSKTAAGTAANTFNFRLGTAGTTSDSSICAFALPVSTAVADVGIVDVLITVRGPLSASCLAQGNLTLAHNLSATGLATIPCVSINTLSGTFDATVANLKASLSCTTAASTVLTFQQVVAEAINLA
jgi:hypothetical protein